MKIYLLLISLCFFFFSSYFASAAINMTVSPIKYEIEVDPGTSITKQATLYNYDDTPVVIVTGKSDFTSNGTTGGPSFVRYSELIHPDQQLSTWISLSSSGFTIPANGSKTIDFTLNVPENATPGGHYGAVFFKNNASEQVTSNGGTTLSINADYGVLILLQVTGELHTQIEIEEPIITDNSGPTTGTTGGGNTPPSNNNSGNNNSGNTGGGGGGGGGTSGGYNNYSQNSNNNLGSSTSTDVDNCVIDFTSSNFDGKCVDNPIEEIQEILSPTDNSDNTDEDLDNNNGGEEASATGEEISNINNPDSQNSSTHQSEEGDNTEESFEIAFDFPIKNTGNTHVKPRGEITLIDENGKQIKGVGKQAKLNDKGAVIGIEVVDFIPINDGGGNVLPQSQRVFGEKWEGFPYQSLDNEGKIVMKNMSPDEYYTNKNLGENRVLMPWERLCVKKSNKTIKALINLTYKNDEGEDVEYSSAKEIPVSYTETYVGINPYIVIPFILFGSIFFILWIILLGKRRRCINKDCRKKIKRSLIRCPHCDEKQRKKFKMKKKK